MRKIDVEMHVRDRSLSTGKKHWILFYIAGHQLFRPCKIIDKLWSMIKNIEKEYAPSCRSLLDHINIFTKGFVIIRRVDGRVSIAFYIVVKRYSFIAYYFFKIIPGPFIISRPFF